MKHRMGFVSNSSSCSFTIVAKKSADEDVRARLKDEFAVSADGVDFSGMSEIIADAYLDTEFMSRFINVQELDHYYREELMYDEKSRDEDEEYVVYKKLLEAGFHVIWGSMPNSGDGGTQLQTALYEAKIDIHKPDFAMLQPSPDNPTSLLYLASAELPFEKE